jgi:hypothetical protein
MARRSRDHRKTIPGYTEARPTRDDRQTDHRRARHAAHQLLHTVADPEELEPLPEVKRNRAHEPVEPEAEVGSRRFRVWKTKFWKRRDSYRDMKAGMDAKWIEVTETPEEAW